MCQYQKCRLCSLSIMSGASPSAEPSMGAAGQCGSSAQCRMSDTRLVISERPMTSSGCSDPRPISGRAVCPDVPGVKTGPWKDISRCLSPHWTKVQYLFSFNSHKFQIVFSSPPLFREKTFESIDRAILSGPEEIACPKSHSRSMRSMMTIPYGGP